MGDNHKIDHNNQPIIYTTFGCFTISWRSATLSSYSCYSCYCIELCFRYIYSFGYMDFLVCHVAGDSCCYSVLFGRFVELYDTKIALWACCQSVVGPFRKDVLRSGERRSAAGVGLVCRWVAEPCGCLCLWRATGSSGKCFAGSRRPHAAGCRTRHAHRSSLTSSSCSRSCPFRVSRAGLCAGTAATVHCFYGSFGSSFA